MDETLKKQLMKTAVNVRMGVLTGTFHAKSGHPGGSLSIADLLTYLYYNKMNVNAQNPDDDNRDRLVLSKGHTAPALYAVLAEKGYFDKKELESLRHIGALLQGHPCIHIPGVDMSSGSLGQGIKILERAGDICREQVKDLFRTESESDEEREGCHEQI